MEYFIRHIFGKYNIMKKDENEEIQVACYDDEYEAIEELHILKSEIEERKKILMERKKILMDTQIDKDMSYSERLAQLKRRHGV